jgi:polar amino acid transport system substrate-binding protein
VVALLLSVLLAVLGAAAVACRPEVPAAAPSRAGSGAATVPDPRPLFRWGGDAEGGAPFVEADPGDPSRVRGFDVEIAGMLAAALGRTPAFVQVAWPSIGASVERGDFALGLSGVEDRPALRARHAVTLPYFEFREVLAVRPADSARFRRLDDLAGRRVGTLGATLAYDLLLDAARRTGLVPVSYDDDVHPYADLVAGRVDAVLLDHVIAERALRRVAGFVVQPAPVATGHYVGVLAGRDSALRDTVDAVLRARMRDGALERTFRGWGVWDATQGAHFARVLAAGPRERAPRGERGAGRCGDRRRAAARRGGGRVARVPARARARGRRHARPLGARDGARGGHRARGGLGRVYGPRPVRVALAAYVEVMRGTPVLLQLFVIYYGLASVVRLPAFAAAVLGLGLNYAAYEAEIYRAALEAIPRPQLEAARTLGLSEFQILRLVRGPQALRLALAPMTNDFVALLKDSSLVSVITVVELTKQAAIYATNAGSWVVPGALCAAVYLAMSLPLSRLAGRLERRWSGR